MPGHGGAAVPCRVVPPCRHPGSGTALRGRRRAGPCPWARQHDRPERRQPGRTMAGMTGAAAQATGGGGGGEVGEDELRLAGDATRQRQGTPPPRSHAGCAPALVAAAAAKARRSSRAAARRRGCGGGDGGVRGRGPSSRTEARSEHAGGEVRARGREEGSGAADPAGGVSGAAAAGGERRCGCGRRGSGAAAAGGEEERRESPVVRRKMGWGSDAGFHGPRPCRPVLMP